VCERRLPGDFFDQLFRNFDRLFPITLQLFKILQLIEVQFAFFRIELSEQISHFRGCNPIMRHTGEQFELHRA